jgi:hypothetical protein
MGQLILFLILIVTGTSIIVFRDFIIKHRRVVGLTIGIILVLSRIGRGVEYIINEEYSKIIPLQICSLAAYFSIIYFLFDWKKIQLPLFFYGFLGLTFFIDPDIPAWDEALRSFFLYGITIDHVITTLAPLFLIIIDKYEVSFKKIIQVFIPTAILVLITWPITMAWDISDFFYIKAKPVFADVFGDSLSFWNSLHYILWYFIAFFLFNIINWYMIKGIQTLIQKKS